MTIRGNPGARERKKEIDAASQTHGDTVATTSSLPVVRGLLLDRDRLFLFFSFAFTRLACRCNHWRFEVSST